VHDFEIELAPGAESQREARAWVRPRLAAWDLDRVADDAELLVSELVANVVRHVGMPMTVRLARRVDAVRVEVDDPSATAPLLRHPEFDKESGRGLLLVAAMASRWGTEHHRDDGKTVWFELSTRLPSG